MCANKVMQVRTKALLIMIKSQCIMQNRIALYAPRPSRAGKYVRAYPPPIFEVKRQPKLVLIHTCTDVLGIIASEHGTNEQCCTNISIYISWTTDNCSYIQIDNVHQATIV